MEINFKSVSRSEVHLIFIKPINEEIISMRVLLNGCWHVLGLS